MYRYAVRTDMVRGLLQLERELRGSCFGGMDFATACRDCVRRGGSGS